MSGLSKLNSKSPTIRRILREAAELSNSPSADYTATPLESDLFEWHFTLRGPPSSVYSEGIYHGRIVLPATYPLRPPSFRFMTPSGRFEANREICLSISGHHEETWQPAWGVRTALVALRSFMETDPKGQLGGLETTDMVRQRLALQSHSFRCSSCGRTNLEIMQEREALANAAQSDSAPAEEVSIPAELKMGWRDEMDKAAGSEGKSERAGQMVLEGHATRDAGDSSAALAEGFVATARSPAKAEELSRQGGEQAVTTTRSLAPAAQSPTGRPVPDLVGAQQMHRAHDDGVPLWVDRVIVVLIVLLAAMVLKSVLKA